MKACAISFSILFAVGVGAAVPSAPRPTFFQQEIARSLGVSGYTLKCAPARKAYLSAAAPREDGLILRSISWAGNAVVFQHDGETNDFIALFDGERLVRIAELASVEKRLSFEAGPPSYLAR
jgi:hypothetical protein